MFRKIIKLTLIGFLLSSIPVSSFSQEKKMNFRKLFEDYLFEGNDTGVRSGKRTDGVLVTQNGVLIFERYARGYNLTKKHVLWSVSKTILALGFGIAESDNKVKLDQSVCDFIKPRRPDQCGIKIKDLLSWTSGIEWNEEYERSGAPTQSSILAMLLGEGKKNMVEFVLSQPMTKNYSPGQVWRYSSGDTILAAKVLSEIYKGQDLHGVLNTKLFKPLNINNWTGEIDGAGTLGAAYYFYLTAPDLLKLGQLLLDRGSYQGKQIISESFVKFMFTVPDAFHKNRLDYDGLNISGASLWLNDNRGLSVGQPWPGAPIDTAMAMGHWGQYLVVIPSLKLVAVRLGDNRDGSITAKGFTGHLVNYIIGMAHDEMF